MIEIYEDDKGLTIKVEGDSEENFIYDFTIAVAELISEGYYMDHGDDLMNIMNKIEKGEKIEKKDIKISDKTHVFKNHFDHFLYKIMPLVVDVCCKYRGYKSNVEERKMMIAGGPILLGLKPLIKAPMVDTIKYKECPFCMSIIKDHKEYCPKCSKKLTTDKKKEKIKEEKKTPTQ